MENLFDIIHEDDEILVVNKPAGMMVHAGAGETEDARNNNTLVNALLFRFKALSATGSDLRPGIVHRLDKDTSGCLVLGRHPKALRRLGALFASGQVAKVYWAVVEGQPADAEGRIETGLKKLTRSTGWRWTRWEPAGATSSCRAWHKACWTQPEASWLSVSARPPRRR